MGCVLLVDDDEAVRESLRWTLEDAGYEVITAESAAVALRVLVATRDPLVVVFDYIMPAMTGDDLVRVAEREVPFLERHMFILCTASPQRLPASLTSWLAQRDAPTMGKPFDVDDLLAAIARETARLPARN